MIASPWPARLRELLRPDEPIRLSEWAERYRVIPRKGAAEPGRYSLDRTPYMREPLDALGDRETREVNLVKGVQIGGSEIGKSAIGGWVDTRSGDILFVLPDQKTAEEHLTDRVKPMLAEPRLRRYTSDRTLDITRGAIRLVHLTIHTGWSGSPQSTASRAIECALFDETDKSQDHAREANTVDLVRDRLVTYPFSKLFTLSTPTTTDGLIWQIHLSCSDQRTFHVPCPHCGTEQQLVWEQVRWERKDETDETKFQVIADALLAGDLAAWYECADCGERIAERQRLKMVRAGRWVSTLPPGTRSARRSYHISALYSPWVKWSRTVVEYLRARISLDYRNFYNAYLALPNEQLSAKPKIGLLEARAREHPAFMVPAWATTVTAGADTQARDGKPYWYWVIRAWGKGMRSRLIAWGRAESLADLKTATLGARFPVEGTGTSVGPLVLAIDVGGATDIDTDDGNTTQLVKRMAREDPARVIPVKGAGGASKPDRTIASKQVDYIPPGGAPTQVLLHTLDTETLKDRVAGLVASEDPVLWEESAAADRVYLNHMTAEEKSRVRIGRKFQLRWINTTKRRNDLWDATIYCLAAAMMLRAEYRRDYKEQKKREHAKQRVSPPAAETPRTRLGPRAVPRAPAGRPGRGRPDRPGPGSGGRDGGGRGGWIKRR